MIWKEYCHKLLLLVLLLLCNCQYSEKMKLRRIVNQSYGKQINTLWSGLQILEDTVIPVTNITKAPITVITCDEDRLCTECLGKYLKGAELLVDYFNSDSVQFVEIISSHMIADIQKVIKGIDSSKVRVLYDENKSFLVDNTLEKIPKKHLGFLIDKNNCVVLAGNPLTNNGISVLYRKYILQMMKNGGIMINE